ncbi:DUF4342 domain-containing protein [Leucobacter sp. wl10]|uniref:DUF4342 domain-containing protein n=1 Tax=Leucobacter sp. wl10 TaxID=2304677 RepID=UPI000E5B0CAA|nr:DUF4342 domain-containing protein [Leucobacter sp. wl10]RGE20113.1 DUF4342 domain-containing protein [Leucobacter sp. wl10]
MTENAGNTGSADNSSNNWYEEFKVKGDELMAKVREIIEEGNARRLYIKRESGETIFEIPLTAGVAVTAASAVLAPILVAVGAVAALATSVTIGVERPQDDKEDESASESAAE